MAFRWTKQDVFLWMICILFFCGTLVLTARADVFVSPDETANAFFAKHFSQTGNMAVADPLHIGLGGSVHPRSILVRADQLIPGSFLGLPMYYGAVLFFFGSWALPFLTPLIFLCAVFAWRRLCEQWFSKEVAFLSALLLLTHPAFWYYASRGLMHNVLFVSLLIFSVFFLCVQPLSHHLAECTHRLGKMRSFQKYADDVLFGLCAGAALTVRTSELFWVIPLFLFLHIVFSKKHFFLSTMFVVMGWGLAWAPLLWLQYNTFGKPFLTAYTLLSPSTSISTGMAVSVNVVHRLYRLMFPFGIHLQTAWMHFRDYGLLLFWWLTPLMIIGCVVMFLQKQTSRVHRWYLGICLVIGLWLAIWYGSWIIHDNPDPNQITIANSYVRYWLPVFVLALPFVASSIYWLVGFIKKPLWKYVAFVILVGGVVMLNIRVVFFSGPDALVSVNHVLQSSRIIRADVFARIPQDGLIITERSDKLFFPERSVLLNLRSPQTQSLLPTLFERNTSLFYYGITLDPKEQTLLNTSFAVHGKKLERIKTYNAESLYQFIPL